MGGGVAGDGELVPIGTIPTSSGRGEEEGVVSVGPEESDRAGRSVTASELVWAEAGKLNTRVINRRAPQKGNLFCGTKLFVFRSAKQVRLQLNNCKRH